MASRNELEVRAAAQGLTDLPANDSVLEQMVLDAEKPEPAVVGGNRPNKLVVNGSNRKTWVTGADKDELDEQVNASKTEKPAKVIDINEPVKVQKRDASGHFIKE